MLLGSASIFSYISKKSIRPFHEIQDPIDKVVNKTINLKENVYRTLIINGKYNQKIKIIIRKQHKPLSLNRNLATPETGPFMKQLSSRNDIIFTGTFTSP